MVILTKVLMVSSLVLVQVDSQMGDFYQDVGQLGSFQGISLAEPRVAAAEAEGEELEARAETRIVRLIEPLKERRRILLASKEMHQVAQDLEDEMVRLMTSCPFSRMSKCLKVRPSTWIPLMLN